MQHSTAVRTDAPETNRRNRKRSAAMLMALAVLMLLPSLAFAADTGGDDLGLTPLLDWLRNLLIGPLGKIGALCAFAVAIVKGIFQGSILGFLTGIGFAVVFYYGPDIILGVFGATI